MTTGQLEKQSRFIKHGGTRRNAGRKKGVPNKLTTALKETILEALDEAHDSLPCFNEDGETGLSRPAVFGWKRRFIPQGDIAGRALMIRPCLPMMSGVEGTPVAIATLGMSLRDPK